MAHAERTRVEGERLEPAACAGQVRALELYPRPLRMRHVRILHAPWLFRLPGMRRFHGYECGPLILLKRPLAQVSNDLVVHELCHVWQDQHRRAFMWLSYLWQGYADNEHEVEARYAAAATRDIA